MCDAGSWSASLLGFNGSAASSSVGNTTPRTSSGSYSSLASLSSSDDFEIGSREAFVADKRAFVFASGINSFYEHDKMTGNFNWRLSPVWQNSGDTPTQNLRLYTDCFFSNAP